MLNFNVLVNPFTRKMLVSARINKISHEAIIEYGDLDEWHTFMFDDEVFDIRLLYDGELEIDIYRATESNTLINKDDSIHVKYKIISKDEF